MPTHPPRGHRGGGRGRRPVPAAYALVTMVVCLVLWTFLDSRVLERSADAGPLGARRTAALAVLRPMAALADLIRVSAITEAIERALGGDPRAPAGGEIDLEPPPPDDTVEAGVSPSPASEPSPLPPPGEPIRTPRPGNKLRVVVVGDSLATGLGAGLEAMVDPELVRVWNQGRISTGLARQDYFNWRRAMHQVVDAYRPDLVVAMLGQNDNQAQRAPDGSAISIGSVEWVQAYREQAMAFLRAATSGGARLVWVGIPIVQDRGRWEVYRRLNGIYREVVAERARSATFLDTWSRFDAPNGTYTAYVPNERGTLQLVRGADGIHLLPSGNDFLAREVIRQAISTFGLTEDAANFSP